MTIEPRNLENNPAPDGSDLPLTPFVLLERFAEMGLPVALHHHPAIFTVAEGKDLDRTIPGTHTRNLFLKDHKGKMFLVTLTQETQIDLKKLSALLGTGRFSFGSPERLWDFLGVRPGSVCPFAILNDHEGQVSLVLEKKMMEQTVINFHPLINTMTIGLGPSDLIIFLEKHGITPQITDLTPAEPD